MQTYNQREAESYANKCFLSQRQAWIEDTRSDEPSEIIGAIADSFFSDKLNVFGQFHIIVLN